jgi:predicted small lipoprotein YifL
MKKLLLFIVLAFAVTACGVKNDLVKPNGQATSKDEHDPSRPPYPLGH